MRLIKALQAWPACIATFAGLLMVPAAAWAQEMPLSLRDSFPLGNDSGVLCQVQNKAADTANVSPFDRSWAVVCRDSALPVGYVFALRDDAGDPAQRLAARRAENVDCNGASTAAAITIDGASGQSCTWRDGGIGYSVVQANRGKVTYFAEGFSVYDSALELALKSVMADKIVDGPIAVATTSVDDSAAFARIQALSLDPDQALGEGYRRNNSGDYADAAQFFETLQQRVASLDRPVEIDPAEFLVNRALQKSNLGEFAEANTLFSEARAMGAASPVQERLLRNFEAIHLINQRQFGAAIARLNAPVPPLYSGSETLRETGEITNPISMRINASDESSDALGLADDLKLTVEERITIIDAQAKHLQATANRLNGNNAGARAALAESLREAVAVREGRVVSIIRLRAQILAELAQISEDEGNYGGAQEYYTAAINLLEVQYPQARALNAAKARYAAYLVRRGRDAEARVIYKDVVAGSLNRRNPTSGMANQISPYFNLLVEGMETQDEFASDFLDATQILVRPGVAETQSILARELSTGDDEAARLFRQSNNLTRSIEQARIRFAALGQAEQTPRIAAQRSETAAQIERLEAQQQQTLIKLADYPQYKAVSGRTLSLDELQDMLMQDEAYVRVSVVGNDVYVFFANKAKATAYRSPMSAAQMETRVDVIRTTISDFDGFQYVTSPFDVENARALYRDLLGPIAGDLASVKHLVFEPDGAMLSLPVNLLITDDASVNDYLTRTESPDADPFDFTGVNWLGRTTDVSTAVSARAFYDARQAPLSRAANQYLGFGQNAAVFDEKNLSGIRGANAASSQDTAYDATNCAWPLGEWNKPISDKELRRAQGILGNSTAQVITGADFTDDNILAKDDMAQYRIVHFATHGLVTAPRPDCPARPALLTSFGGQNSDGLLTFKEIFDLDLDADMVILSACDTAGRATVSATRDAGITTGGGSALDGLVRSFIGAGGRSVLASHWPAPDDFDATTKLISGMFEAQQGTSIVQALNIAQRPLMDDPLTSHPYYWSGFAVVGDGRRPFINSAQSAAASTASVGSD